MGATAALFFSFSPQQWQQFGENLPLSLDEQSLAPLIGHNETLSLEQVKAVYLPIVRLLEYRLHQHLSKQQILQRFFHQDVKQTPFIISIAGSVAVGKSTFARVLQALLSATGKKVELLATDGFLYSLEQLIERNLLDRKGFPESYNTKALIDCMIAVKNGEKTTAPLYSHISYDLVPHQVQIIDNPDILILEGLNVLQPKSQGSAVFVSDMVDFSIYLDAPHDLIEHWYVERFLSFCTSIFTDPNSYFHHFADLTPSQARAKATEIWRTINLVNLQNHIQPTRERAELIITKGAWHRINQIQLRK